MNITLTCFVYVPASCQPFAGLADPPTPRIGNAQCIPVPDRSQQSSLLLQVAQHHQPDVLVVGELSIQQEVAAAVRISRSCNVLLVAAAPASDLGVLLQDSELCQLLGYNRVGPRGVVAHRLRLCPFSLAVELQGNNRCGIHSCLSQLIVCLNEVPVYELPCLAQPCVL
jgi:hypothetical protein